MSSISAVLGVVVGVASLFLLLSLIASAAAEVISTVFRLRSTMLERTVRALLTGMWTKAPDPANAHEEATARLLSDPRCRTGFPGMKQKRPQPAYLATPTFVDLLFAHFIEPGKPDGARTAEKLAGLPDGGAGEVLRRLWEDADHNVELFREKVGHWYDDAMSRLSAWYKRRLRLILFGLGALLALGLNISLLSVSKTLWVDPVTREAVMAQARAAQPATGTESTGQAASDLLSTYRDLTDKRLPLGWRTGAMPRTPWGWIAAIVGWLIVALGVSMGAPFWFDVLMKFSNLRLSPDPPGTERRRDGPDPTDPIEPTTVVVHQTASPQVQPTGMRPAPLNTVPASVRTGFDSNVHGFHFDNDFQNRYELPFTVGKSITTFGRCGGMAYSSLDLFNAKRPVPDLVEPPPDASPLARYLMRRLIDSWINPSATRFATWSTRDDQTIHALTGHEIDVLTATLDRGDPVPLGMIAASSLSGLSHNHQILATGYDRHADGSINIHVYDNNHHDEDGVLTWRPDELGVSAADHNGWRGFFVHSYHAQEPPDLV